MAEQFFIRLRGRVQGPYTLEQLHELAKRGRFSRLHEVSRDGTVWSRASGQTELFPTSGASVGQVIDSAEPEPAAIVGTTGEEAWYYHRNGARHGPISLANLQGLAQQRELSASDLVWKQGMQEWTPAGHVLDVFQAERSSPPEIPVNAHSEAQSSSSTTHTKACPFCAEQIAGSAIKCKHCGSILVPLQENSVGLHGRSNAGQIPPSAVPYDPLLMAILSGCCITGLGQIILGQTMKGLIILAASIALAVLTGGISVFVVLPLAAIDAYLIAKKLKLGKRVGAWECF